MRRSKWCLSVMIRLASLLIAMGMIMHSSSAEAAGQFLVGTGMYDITGPAAECGMMGYSMPDQTTEGIHMRLRSRAFVVVDPASGKRVALVIAEAGIIPQGIHQAVVKKLLSKYKGLYTEKNVTISATHTHSGPGAYSHYALYNLSMFGYDEKHFNTVADGIYQSIIRAHNNLKPGDIRISMGDVHHCGWNRSPLAYEENPAREKARYHSNTDKTMTLLRFIAADGSDLGMVNWYAVHPTSIGNTNKLISGDNKGYASYLFEKEMGTDYGASNTFVAAFAESNAGDVSPNIYWGYPNGVDDYDHMMTIGRCQYDKSVDLFNEAAVNLAGSVDYRHMYVDWSNQYVSPEFLPPDHTGGRTTCVAAIGVSMLAGSTEDGKGIDIPEGITYPYDISLLGKPFPFAFTVSPFDQKCHGKKPIVLPTGRIKFQGIPLTPDILPVQILKIGNLAIIAMPTEITTMAGRRLKETVMKALGGQVDYLVIAALSNGYAEYVATYEEYNLQHYEGASTLFGPYTLNAFQEKFHDIAQAMKRGVSVSSGPMPRDIEGNQIIKVPGVVFDDVPAGKNFGSVYAQPKTSYARGEIVSAVFWGGHPKNDYRIQDTFLVIEKLVDGVYVPVARDWDPETTYRWARNAIAYSKITITWDTTNALPGTYRVRHKGNWKSGWTGKISPYEGVTNSFILY